MSARLVPRARKNPILAMPVNAAKSGGGNTDITPLTPGRPEKNGGRGKVAGSDLDDEGFTLVKRGRYSSEIVPKVPELAISRVMFAKLKEKGEQGGALHMHAIIDFLLLFV